MSQKTTEKQKSDMGYLENSVRKIVVRRLPKDLTKEQFLDIVSPLPEYDYFYYSNADTR
jgi:regulator of nonsense transcripts 3